MAPTISIVVPFEFMTRVRPLHPTLSYRVVPRTPSASFPVSLRDQIITKDLLFYLFFRHLKLDRHNQRPVFVNLYISAEPFLERRFSWQSLRNAFSQTAVERGVSSLLRLRLFVTIFVPLEVSNFIFFT